eukprot:335617-Amphidinium_carterae.1
MSATISSPTSAAAKRALNKSRTKGVARAKTAKGKGLAKKADLACTSGPEPPPPHGFRTQKIKTGKTPESGNPGIPPKYPQTLKNI